jgi:glycosidase
MNTAAKLGRFWLVLVAVFTLFATTITVTPAISAGSAYDVVVHIPGPTGFVPADASITLTDSSLSSNTESSRLIGQDSYGWFAVVAMPSGAVSVKVTGSGVANTSIPINPATTREVWLASSGVPYLSEFASSPVLRLNLVASGSALKYRSAKVTIGKSVKTYAFKSSGTRRYLNLSMSAKTTSVKVTILKSGRAGKSYSINPQKTPRVWVGDSFSGVRTSAAWAANKAVIHYHRANADYSGWGIHSWSNGSSGGTSLSVNWNSPIAPVSEAGDAWGMVYEIPLVANSASVPFIIHNGNLKDPSNLDQLLNLAATKGEVWIEAGRVNTDNTVLYTIPVSLTDVSIPVTPVAVTAPTSAQASSLASASVRSAFAADNIYFVLTDRYQNASTANDHMGVTGSRELTAFDPTSTAYYHGGDLLGLTDGCTTGTGVKRIKDMGFTSIWITPPFKQRYVQSGSAAYHGYWITDFTDIDPHLGTKAQFKDFVDCVHSQGMKVVLDIVINHTGDVNYYPSGNYNFGAQRTAAVSSNDTNLRKPAFLNDLTNYHNRGDVQDWNNKEQSQNGDFFGLDDVATEKPAVIEGFAQAYAAWVNDYDVDGFRIDTAKHVDDAFFGKWWPRIKELTAVKKPDLFAYGEVFDSSTANLTQFVRDRGLPATLDFAFQNAAVQFASGNNITDITNVFNADDWYINSSTNAYNQVTFLANHDMGRFGQLLKWAGDPDGDLWGDALLGYDLMYMSRGIPNVYYGDEVGIIGTGGDQAARQDMFATLVNSWKTESRIAANPIGTGSYLTITDHPIQERISWLNSLRNDHPALKTGAQINRYSANNVIAFSRIDLTNRKEYLVALNNSQQTKSSLRIKTSSPNTVFTQVWGQTQSVTSDADGYVTIWVGDRQAVVLQAQSQLPAANTVGAVTLTATKDLGVALWKPKATIANWNDPSTCTFVVQVNGGAWQVLGVDDSFDWKMILQGSKYPAGAKINIAAIVKSTSGAIGISNAIQITNYP